MSKIQAVILVGEPEDVVKALREYLGKPQAAAVIDAPDTSDNGRSRLEDGQDVLVNFIKRVLTRSDVAPRHKELLRHLYEAGEQGMLRGALVEAMGLTTKGLQGIVGPLGRRVASTAGHDQVAAADGQHAASGLLLEFKRIDDDWNYSLRAETRRALEELRMV